MIQEPFLPIRPAANSYAKPISINPCYFSKLGHQIRDDHVH